MVVSQRRKKKMALNKLQELMVITMEECGELAQRCSKTIRKFDTIEQALEDTEVAVHNRTKLLEEVGDVQCLINLMVECGLLTKEEIDARIASKRDKLKTWSELVE
jgi:NTP pyrophosphatase (non-canonical NTP hydrolase)